MRRSIICYGGLAAIMLGMGLWRLLPADEPAEAQLPNDGRDQFQPHWQVGQQWLVETVSPVTQARHERQPGQPVRWQFAVQGMDKVDGRECFKVAIHCLVQEDVQPVSTLWVERHTLALRQVQTRLPVAGGYRALTESYVFADGQATPVLAPLPALPLDMPLFRGADTTSRKFVYDAISTPDAKKRLGEVSFGFEVEQQVTRAQPEQVRQLLAEEFRNDRPMLEVKLKAPGRPAVRQVWQLGLPWPAYSDNGTTVARLVKDKPRRESQPEKEP